MPLRISTVSNVRQGEQVCYGLLLASRPVIVWNVIGVVINLAVVLAYRRLRRSELSERAA
jgi:hypothetical protein